MKILSVIAQKPDSTGSGVYLTELINALDKQGHTQAVVAGVCKTDVISLPDKVDVYPVFYETNELPFPVAGMSDEMPYSSTRYSDMTEEMTRQFTDAFRHQILHAIDKLHPDIILCHHLYLLTAIVRDMCPDLPVYAICHGSDLRQIKKNPKNRAYILTQIPRLNSIFALHQEQKEQICKTFSCAPEFVRIIGTGYNSDVFCINTDIIRKEEPLSLLFAGKLSEKKGVFCLLRSLQYFTQPITLSLAGGHGDAAEYKKICRLAEQITAAAPQKQVHFLGKLNHIQLAEEMNRHQIFILPSFYEGLPLVTMEALACGMKVVCTDLPGIRPWMNANLPANGVVFVTPPRMHNEDEPLMEDLVPFERRLADAVQKAIHTAPEEPERMQHLSWDGLAQRLISSIAEQPF